LTETKPIHHSLFETIKVAIASDENNLDMVEPEEEPDLEAKASGIKEDTHKQPEAMSPLRTCAKFISSSFWALPNEYKVISSVILFGAVWMFSRSSMGNDQQKIDELNRKVDQLNSELAEIKTLLSTIVHLMNENGQRIQNDEL
jgi:hypothetical protein